MPRVERARHQRIHLDKQGLSIIVFYNWLITEREKMAKKSNKVNEKPSFAEILESKNPELRESFFASDASDDKPNVRVQEFIEKLRNNGLFKTKRSVAIVTAIVTFVFTFSISSIWAPNPMDTTTLAARISGGVALTESQLREVVAQIDQKVYWAGPMSGAKYTINAQNFNSIYVRYLANGKGISDQTPKYRVIATYKEANAYNSTLSAGNQANGLSFTKPDGRVVYYNKQVPTNVYVAYKTDPYQIEIFDPDAKKSLEIANAATALQLIK